MSVTVEVPLETEIQDGRTEIQDRRIDIQDRRTEVQGRMSVIQDRRDFCVQKDRITGQKDPEFLPYPSATRVCLVVFVCVCSPPPGSDLAFASVRKPNTQQ